MNRHLGKRETPAFGEKYASPAQFVTVDSGPRPVSELARNLPGSGWRCAVSPERRAVLVDLARERAAEFGDERGLLARIAQAEKRRAKRLARQRARFLAYRAASRA